MWGVEMSQSTLYRLLAVFRIILIMAEERLGVYAFEKLAALHFMESFQSALMSLPSSTSTSVLMETSKRWY